MSNFYSYEEYCIEHPCTSVSRYLSACLRLSSNNSKWITNQRQIKVVNCIRESWLSPEVDVKRVHLCMGKKNSSSLTGTIPTHKMFSDISPAEDLQNSPLVIQTARGIPASHPNPNKALHFPPSVLPYPVSSPSFPLRTCHCYTCFFLLWNVNKESCFLPSSPVCLSIQRAKKTHTMSSWGLVPSGLAQVSTSALQKLASQKHPGGPKGLWVNFGDLPYMEVEFWSQLISKNSPWQRWLFACSTIILPSFHTNRNLILFWVAIC